jgi:hypothetical protein
MNVITAKNLTAPPVSHDWMRRLRTSLDAFAGPGDPIAAALYDENWAGRQAWHAVYSVGLQTILHAKKLDAIDKPLCWRFIAGGHKGIKTADGCWATHELCGLPAKVLATFRNREMAEILADAEQLNILNEVSGHPGDNYELRILRIPALCLEAFWLKSLSAKRCDLIVPYGLVVDHDLVKLGGGRTLHKNKAYPVAEFLKAVGPAAQQRLKVDERPPHTTGKPVA